jgi:long-subunit acyl-CoA synthetase (AMP-forming)
MQTLFDAMARHAGNAGDVAAISDDRGSLSRREVLAKVAGLAADLAAGPRVVGIFAPNGREWAIAQLACAFAGKIVVPLPTFFSATQLGHVVGDAAVELVLATEATWATAQRFGVAAKRIDTPPDTNGLAQPVPGFGQIIYTSGSTGMPKGVRHASGQVDWSAAALAAATGACEQDVYLSVLPLPLLLETICAVFIPPLVGARVHFEQRLAEGVGRGDVGGIADAFDAHRPTMSVIVPQLLKVWNAELLAKACRAPASLRFVAVGGAPVSGQVADTAWQLGIPAHEGYGLSECCSVVAVNRAGARRPGTVGRPLEGIDVVVDNGEIVVDGPSVTDGYLGQGAAARPWRTGDLGALDADGFLTVHGRKDNLIVTAFGRNVSPEWIETMLLGDARIASCAVLGHGEPALTAVLIASPQGADWFTTASEADRLALVSELCAGAPDYARPTTAVVLTLDGAMRHQLLTANGRIRRAKVAEFLQASPPSA